MYIIASRMPAPPSQNLRFFTIFQKTCTQYHTFEPTPPPDRFAPPSGAFQISSKTKGFSSFWLLTPCFASTGVRLALFPSRFSPRPPLRPFRSSAYTMLCGTLLATPCFASTGVRFAPKPIKNQWFFITFLFLKPQASSVKPQTQKSQASSLKPQASLDRPWSPLVP